MNEKTILLIIIIFLLIGGYLSIMKLVKNFKRKINQKINRQINSIINQVNPLNLVYNNKKEILNAVKEISEEPEIKSVGGSTSLFLNQITKDFPSFHSKDAEAAIKTFIIEFLNVRYRNQIDFKLTKINKNILLNINKEIKATISNIKINGIAIYNYVKTSDYATISYKCSFGYDINGKRKEERYDIDYTLQLNNPDDGQEVLICENCGASISSTKYTACPYCDTKIILDTIMTWQFTKLNKNY